MLYNKRRGDMAWPTQKAVTEQCESMVADLVGALNALFLALMSLHMAVPIQSSSFSITDATDYRLLA